MNPPSVSDLGSDNIMSDDLSNCDHCGIVFTSIMHPNQHKEQGCRKGMRHNSDAKSELDSNDGFEFLIEYIQEENQDEFDDFYKTPTKRCFDSAHYTTHSSIDAHFIYIFTRSVNLCYKHPLLQINVLYKVTSQGLRWFCCHTRTEF